jgi:hypothetical protein
MQCGNDAWRRALELRVGAGFERFKTRKKQRFFDDFLQYRPVKDSSIPLRFPHDGPTPHAPPARQPLAALDARRARRGERYTF